MPELRSFEEMLEVMEKESGIPHEKLLLAIAETSEGFGSQEKNDLELMGYIYGSQILKIPESKLQKNVMMEKADYVLFKDVNENSRGLFNARGYFISKSEGTTMNGHPKIKLTIADESGVKSVSFYNEATNLVKNLDPQPKFGEALYIQGINVYKPEGLGFATWGLSVSGKDEITLEHKSVTRLTAGEFKLPAWTEVLSKEIKVKSTVLLSGIITSIQARDYLGCPKCLRTPKDAEGNKMNVKVGEEFLCSGKFCGKVLATKHTFTTITIRDNLKKTRNIVLSPRQYIPKDQSMIAQRMNVFGRVKDRENEVNAIAYAVEKLNLNLTPKAIATPTNTQYAKPQLDALKQLSELLSGVAKLMLNPTTDGGYALPSLKTKLDPIIIEKFPDMGLTFEMIMDYAKTNGTRLAIRDNNVYFGEA